MKALSISKLIVLYCIQQLSLLLSRYRYDYAYIAQEPKCTAHGVKERGARSTEHGTRSALRAMCEKCNRNSYGTQTQTLTDSVTVRVRVTNSAWPGRVVRVSSVSSVRGRSETRALQTHFVNGNVLETQTARQANQMKFIKLNKTCTAQRTEVKSYTHPSRHTKQKQKAHTHSVRI